MKNTAAGSMKRLKVKLKDDNLVGYIDGYVANSCGSIYAICVFNDHLYPLKFKDLVVIND